MVRRETPDEESGKNRETSHDAFRISAGAPRDGDQGHRRGHGRRRHDRRDATQAATVDGSEAGDIWSSEYWTKKGDIPLWMYRKRIGAPKPGEPARPVVFFVHGSSVTSRVFDLQCPRRANIP